MKSFEITNETKNSQYTYKNDDVVVNGNFAKNVQNNTLLNVSGAVYEKNGDGSMGINIGSFNGYLRDGSMKYSISEAAIGNLGKIEVAMEDIIEEITKENAAE